MVAVLIFRQKKCDLFLESFFDFFLANRLISSLNHFGSLLCWTLCFFFELTGDIDHYRSGAFHGSVFLWGRQPPRRSVGWHHAATGEGGEDGVPSCSAEGRIHLRSECMYPHNRQLRHQVRRRRRSQNTGEQNTTRKLIKMANCQVSIALRWLVCRLVLKFPARWDYCLALRFYVRSAISKSACKKKSDDFLVSHLKFAYSKAQTISFMNRLTKSYLFFIYFSK